MEPTDSDEARVTAYLDGLPDQARERVDQVRAAVHAAVPGLGEKISYELLAFTVDGRSAFYVGGHAAHTGLYPVPEDVTLAERAEPYRTGKGTLRFPHTQEIPIDLVEDVAQWFAAAARERRRR